MADVDGEVLDPVSVRRGWWFRSEAVSCRHSPLYFSVSFLDLLFPAPLLYYPFLVVVNGSGWCHGSGHCRCCES